jgi:hypothetical protein
LEDGVRSLLVEDGAFFVKVELIEFCEDESPRYKVQVAYVLWGVGVRVAEECVKGLPLGVSIFIRGNSYRSVNCVKYFFEAWASA